MTLGFKTEIKGKPTYFPEKIIAGLDLPDSQIMTLFDALGDVTGWTDEEFIAGKCNPLFNHLPKITTIRADPKNNWPPKTGLIHPVIKNRTPERYQFAPTLNCVSVQTIKIKRKIIEAGVSKITVLIDGKKFHHKKWNTLAVNDGFAFAAEFFNYFDKDFTGKIIHWTDLKY